MVAQNKSILDYNHNGVYGVEQTYGHNEKSIKSINESKQDKISELKGMGFLSKMLNVASSYMKNCPNVYTRIKNLKQEIAIGNALLKPDNSDKEIRAAFNSHSLLRDSSDKESQIRHLKSLQQLINTKADRQPLSGYDEVQHFANKPTKLTVAEHGLQIACMIHIEEQRTGHSGPLQNLRDSQGSKNTKTL